MVLRKLNNYTTDIVVNGTNEGSYTQNGDSTYEIKAESQQTDGFDWDVIVDGSEYIDGSQSTKSFTFDVTGSNSDIFAYVYLNSWGDSNDSGSMTMTNLDTGNVIHEIFDESDPIKYRDFIDCATYEIEYTYAESSGYYGCNHAWTVYTVPRDKIYLWNNNVNDMYLPIQGVNINSVTKS